MTSGVPASAARALSANRPATASKGADWSCQRAQTSSERSKSPARPNRAQRSACKIRDALTQGDVVGRHERTGTVLGRDKLRRPPGRGRNERNSGVEAFRNRKR